MRRRNRIIPFFLASLILLLAPSASHATPVGGLSYNLGAPGFSLSSGVGFQERDVHLVKDENIIEQSSSSRFLVKLDAAPLNFLDFYGLIGTADFQLSDVDYRGRLSPIYGGGVRPMILPYGFNIPFYVSADLRYTAFTTEDHHVEARYQEFQGALIISYKLKGAMPFGGFKYNPLKVDMSGLHNNLEGDADTGVFIGCDWFVTPNVFFSGEASIFSETAAYMSVGYNYPTSF